MAVTWALIAFELPTAEAPGTSELGLRAAVLLLTFIALPTVLWDETLLSRQPVCRLQARS